MKFHLHIGLEKTGTTSVQNALSENTDNLTKQGFTYYRSPFPSANGHYPNAAELLPYALASSKQNQLKITYVGESNENLAWFRSRFRKSILDFSNYHANKDIIFSLEHLSRSLTLNEEWSRLKTLVEDTGRKPVVHVYLRRQDDFCLSFYSTELIHGRTSIFEFPAIEGPHNLLNYSNLLEGLVTVFGKSNVNVYSYEFDLNSFAGTLEHFAHQIGLDSRKMKQSEDNNPRMGAKESEFLRQFNSHVLTAGLAKIPSHILRKAIQSESIIDGIYEPGYAERADFLRPLFSSNNFVNKEFFSGRHVLPTTEKDIKNNNENTANLDINDCLQIFYKLLSGELIKY